MRRPLVSSYTPAISQKLIPKKKDRNDSYEYFKGEPPSPLSLLPRSVC